MSFIVLLLLITVARASSRVESPPRRPADRPGILSTMPQVPKVQLFAAYFPQWHQTPLNDYWFGPNFTDWALLCNHVRAHGGINRLRRKTPLPLPPPNGLGWYDLNDQWIRRRQALLAREYGIHGFAYYHFWFTRPAAWGGNLDDALIVNGTRYAADMDETLLKLLDEHDGEPNLPFYFVWANEAFVWKWNWPHGRVSMLRPGATQVPQNYERPGWQPHFRYLLRFFMHRNYHKVDGKPVFAIYQANQKSRDAQAALDEMMRLFQIWAVDAGLAGLHLLQFHHGHSSLNAVDIPSKLRPWANGLQDFGRGKRTSTPRASGHHKTLYTSEPKPTWLPAHVPWHPGLLVDFDNTPRLGPKADIKNQADSFDPRLDAVLAMALAYAHERNRTARPSTAMVLIVAWNEWSEGCALEPSSDRRFEHLQAVRAVLRRHGQYRLKPGCGSSGASRLAGLATDVHKSTAALQQWTECACGDAPSSRAATDNSSNYRLYFCGTVLSTVLPQNATDLEQQRCA